MYLEAKETARLYKLLTDKLGDDTAEAMFKYIDNKTERSVEATIRNLATKDDIAATQIDIGGTKADVAILKTYVAILKTDVAFLKTDVAILKTDVAAVKTDIAAVKTDIAGLKIDIAAVRSDLRKEISESKADTIKWMFIFWVGQVGAMLAILFLKK